MGHLETLFLRQVYYKDLGDEGLNFITPEVNIPRNDGTNRNWRIDFVIKTRYAKYAIECNGYHAHALGGRFVTPERFNELNEKANEVRRQGYIFVNLTYDQIENTPEEAVYQLRRDFIADKQLFDIFLRRNLGRIEPTEVQEMALDKLEDTRDDGENKGLVVLATGLGKTYLSGFDAKQLDSKKILFLVHVFEILKKTRNSFEELMPNRAKDMGFIGKGFHQKDKKIIFATVQTLTKDNHLNSFKPDYFDYIIFDETHHLAAPTFEKVYNYFKPKFFLGLTATPERNDQKKILPFYNNNIVFRMDQEEAIKKGFLTGIRYLGFLDDVDYSTIYYNGSHYDINDLNKALMIENRDNAIINKYKELAKDKKAIGFCTSTEHANWCTQKFNEAGIKSVAIHSKLDHPDIPIDLRKRDKLIEDFEKGKYKVAFTVNMFNEGVDFPDVECLLLLRPTESVTILTQQIGRGLRISPGKKEVIILDFIGNYKTAHKILSALGINGVGELIYDKEKDIYYYDNNGRQVVFESEVVKIFRIMSSRATKKVRPEVLDEKWIEYADYLEKWTKKNLYWKIGQQNRHFDVQLEGLNIIQNNPGISESDFVKQIQSIVKKKYPKKGMSAGFRALMLSKVAGLVNAKSPLKVTNAFINLKKSCKGDFSSLKYYHTILTTQLEKIFYFNSIYGTYNKYVKAEKRVSFEDFKIYPFFFIYDVLIRLIDEYDQNNSYLSEIEFNSFIAVIKSHSEIQEVLDRIINFRNYKEKYELEKLLKQKNKIDPRFYKILGYNKYLIVNKRGIKLNEEYLEELREKVIKFRELIDSNKLILFNESDPKAYFKLLYSKKDLISFHR